MSKLSTIPASCSFLDVLALGLLQQSTDLLSLPRTTIFLPTRRACRFLREAFLRHSDKPLLLPKMLPLGELDAEDLALHGAAEIAPTISPLRRQALLAQALLQSGFSPTAVEAAAMAKALAGFLDEMQDEGLDFTALDELVPDLYAAHWQQTLKLLHIVREIWPQLLAIEQAIDPAQRREQLFAAQIRQWQETPPAERVIVAGSTGSLRGVRGLMQAVLALPQGEVILPALDRDLDEESWAVLDSSHPQYYLRQVLAALDIPREAVPDWAGLGDCQPPVRQYLITEIFRPAATTEQWQSLDTARIAAGTEGIVRLDCATPREEAEAIACLLRETLETPGKRAALVTPDRTLARLVRAALARWEIEIDDSAGSPLLSSPPGSFLRLVAQMVEEDFAPIALLACFKHPLAEGGLPKGEFRRRTRLLELKVLRGPAPAPGLNGILQALSVARMAEDDRLLLFGWLRQLVALCEEFHAAMQEATPPAALLHRHVALAEALATSENGTAGDLLWAEQAGEELAAFVNEAQNALEGFPALAARTWPGFFASFIAGQVVRPRAARHSHLFVWGLIEARLQQVDLMILGGLNEDVWPEATPADPFLSRPMREKLGLPLQECRISLAAHDFAAGLAAPRVVLTRAERSGGAPTVPSRWLLRFAAVLQAAGAELAIANIAPMLMQQLDTPAAYQPIPRPAPTPPVSARPRQLSVTDIETWLADPYRLYARRVLRLRELDDIAADPGAAERGEIIHTILDRFLQLYPGDMPPNALPEMVRIGQAVFAGLRLPPAVEIFWWPRFLKVAEWVVAHETVRRTDGIRLIASEAKGGISFTAPGGEFTLTAKADRFDQLPDGTLEVIDYKTGTVPTKIDVVSGGKPQLALEAAMAARNGFPQVPDGIVSQLTYWRLSGGDPPGKEEKRDPPEFDILERLAARVAAYDNPAQPYTAQTPGATAERLGYHQRYEQLSRVREWAGSGEDDAE
jgi:ATP-dependent helicase/nuclease subunit B